MNKTVKTSLLQQSLEAVEALSLEDQAWLLDTCGRGLKCSVIAYIR